MRATWRWPQRARAARRGASWSGGRGAPRTAGACRRSRATATGSAGRARAPGGSRPSGPARAQGRSEVSPRTAARRSGRLAARTHVVLAHAVDEQRSKLALGLLAADEPARAVDVLPDLALLGPDLLLALAQARLGPLLLLARLAHRRVLRRVSGGARRASGRGGRAVPAREELDEELLAQRRRADGVVPGVPLERNLDLQRKRDRASGLSCVGDDQGRRQASRTHIPPAGVGGHVRRLLEQGEEVVLGLLGRGALAWRDGGDVAGQRTMQADEPSVRGRRTHPRRARAATP